MTIKTVVYYTTREAAEMLGISRVTLQKWVEKGKVMVGHTLGGHHRFTLEDINEIRREMGLPPLEEVPESGL